MELLDIDDESTSSDTKTKKRPDNLLRALLVTGICVAVLLALLIGILIYAYKKGIVVAKQEEETDAEQPIYTEAQMQEKLEEANEDAELILESETKLAQDEGYAQGKNELLEYIKDMLLNTNSSLSTFRALYPDSLIVVSNNTYHFLQIDRSLEQSSLVQDRLEVTEDGEFQYTDESGNVISHKGIDVSEYQGKINWEKVAADGVEFAIVRGFYRGYGTGRFVTDEKAVDNIIGAVDNDIHVGLYVFSQAINEEEAVEEATEAIDMLSPYVTGGVPIVIDVEKIAGADARMDALTVDERTDVILKFCDTVTEAGYIPMLYYNTEMGALLVDLERLEGIEKWYAWYDEQLYFPYKYSIWQYKDTGSVDGISGNVDLNIAFETWWDEEAEQGQ